MSETSRARLTTMRDRSTQITGGASDYDTLLDLVDDARIVLLGEATHGTHEFYAERARITRRLIEEKGFTTIAVEADWPDAYRLNRYIRATGEDESAEDALGDFRRFPLWMWRNTDVLDLAEWLRHHNEARESADRVGFYGLDLYSLYGSIRAVLEYLEDADPAGARIARERYACFDHLGDDSQAYGYEASLGIRRSCEDEAVRQLVDLQRRAGELAARDGRIPEDEYFFAEQNARLVKNAEEYYRTMFRGRVSSWNLRDRHMSDTLAALVGHFDEKGLETKVVVWEHNSHVGDARATEMGLGGEWNVGQLARERFGNDARLVGFSTYTGTVTAATNWDEPAERRWVRPGLPGSYEELLHEVDLPQFLLTLDDPELREALYEPRLQRAIGVIYRPETERGSHYFRSRLPDQFDAIIHIDESSALQPLEATQAWHEGETPDTFPFEV
ncbi:MAG: erythromycin esterase family protein [Gemmatimonas sp.]|nr:erythromycin esterase family protein [Gemmatimonas sp.]